MRFVIFVLTITCLPFMSIAQVDIEKTSKEICDCVIKEAKPLEELGEICYLKIFNNKTTDITDPELLDSIHVRIVKHLSKTCKPVAFDTSTISTNTSIKAVETDRKSLLNEQQCKTFTDYRSLYYIESWGDTTNVKVTDSQWLESFPDGSYSNLKFKWLKSCHFETEFIESNHYLKKDASSKGDKFSYQIIDHNKQSKYFLVYIYVGKFIFEAKMQYH